MSWLLGFIGERLSPARRAALAALHPMGAVFADDAAYLAAGGLALTCHTGTGEAAAWGVVGLGLRREAGHTRLLDADDWAARLAPETPALANLDGHFVALRRRPDRLDAFTDALGTRTLYLARLADGTACSTRLDWLARLTGHTEIDLAAFGTHWLTFNQFATNSLVWGLERLGPGGHAVLTPEGFTLHETPFTPAPDDGDGTALEATLTALLRPRLPAERTRSLGLSGGLDSRLLLALATGDDAPFALHTFGPPAHPDVRVATAIAQRERHPFRAFHAPLPDADTCLALLRTHVAQTHAVSPASAVLGLRYFPDLFADGAFLLDGGFGEIARRQYLNRLRRLGRPALATGDPQAILPYLRFARAEVFTEEALAAMTAGAEAQIALCRDALPADGFDEENRLDLLAVRTRLPNFFGYEQNRLDGLIPNYMPYAQPSFLRAVFATRMRLRRDGRLFRRLIRTRAPRLTRHPLVKGGHTYPFRLGTLPAHAWTHLKGRLVPGFADARRTAFLDALRPFALDAVHSAEVRAYAPYDRARLTALVEGYYAGDASRAVALDWWLAFEVWRQSLRAG